MLPDRVIGSVTLGIAAILLVLGVGAAVAYTAGKPPPLPAFEGQPAPAVTADAPPAPTGDTATVRDRFQPSAAWISTTSTATGIPPRALESYARANLRIADEQPGCRVGWTTIAAIGGIESGHGSANDAVLGEDGWPRPGIVGPALSGGKFGVVRDSDDGALDGDTTWDHAVGPLQFIPQTWEQWGADGNNDGTSDPNQIDDAALAASRYLCHSGDLGVADNWRRAIFSFNHSDVYVADIASLANQYAARVS
ncbi:lytic murein transglycosylase [Nocardioides sp. WS12]|uniref:lytic murein transglycosylase n=1 Tax=Nocardioides sp. WS12 TaxID=2486272 RepID=UPI0015FCA71F|nr:lytic murein transglycosylase [Nocardioides sp. WS12]